MSWLDAVHRGHASAPSARVGGVDDLAQRASLERRHREREVERHVQLAALGVVEGELGQVAHPRLADQHARRIVGVGNGAPPPQHVVHLGPVHAEGDLRLTFDRRRIVAKLIVLDDGVRHVDPEPGHASIEPTPQDLVERPAHVLVPPVEVGLPRQEVVQVVLARRLVQRPCRSAAERALPVVRRPSVGRRIRPHVPVPMLGVPAPARIHEPRMAIARVVRHQVEQHPDLAGRSRIDQSLQGTHTAELGRHVVVVRHVVPPVAIGAGMDRIEPDAVDAEPREMIEPADHTIEIADPVTIGILERARIRLVQHTVLPPDPSVAHAHGPSRYPPGDGFGGGIAG